MSKDVVSIAVAALALFACGGRAAAPKQTPGSSGSGGSYSGGSDDAGGPPGVSANAGGGGLDSAGSGGVPEVTAACVSYMDCEPLHCASCDQAPGGCPPSDCVDGQCFHPTCSALDACAGKSCGDACSACYALDGDCTPQPGFCDRWGDCKESESSCDPNEPRPCTPLDARGAGFVSGKTCNVVQGWGWGGEECVPVVGCICEGSDCRSLLQTQTDCSATFASCVHK